MNRKYIIAIIAIVILAVIIVVSLFNKKGHNEDQATTSNSNISSQFNNTTNLYEIYDENTGEIIDHVTNEDEVESILEFYKEHPDYRANPPMGEVQIEE